MLFKKYVLVLRKVETIKNTSERLQVFMLLGPILDNQIDIN